MAKVPIFHGRVTDDGLVLEFRDTERALRKAHLKSLAGRNVECVVRKEHVQRSVDQNAYLHAEPFQILAEEFGLSVEEVKYALMGECWGWHIDPISKREVPVKPSTSSMTVEECTLFIDWLIPWALTKWKITLPYPNEKLPKEQRPRQGRGRRS